MLEPRISVLIPTRGRAGQLATCLARLASQDVHVGTFEILVGLDGLDPESGAVVEDYDDLADIRLIQCRRQGIAQVKNELLAEARGEFILLINDDVEPDPCFIREHLAAHDRRPGPGMILGYSPWVSPPFETQFDRLIARTSMIFFYDQMLESKDPETDWGFRCAWNLNLSLPTEAARAVGGFRPAIANCCFEDLEFAYRLQADGLAVRFEPGAIAAHRHVYTPQAYLEREHRLGYSAFGVALIAPECARAIFHRDILANEHIRFIRSAIETDEVREPELRQTFDALAQRPADAWPDDDWIPLAYEHHLVLKRLAFRRGLIDALEGRLIEDWFHPTHGLPAEPGLLAARAGAA